MIHVVDGDPRVPSPQSIELHMVRGQGKKFSWREGLKTLDDAGGAKVKSTTNDDKQP